jgi:glutamate dehydrogenase/leucine dehydrogenase
LVAAAQVTGKPKRGIAARGAATGLGMAYATLAAVGNLYLEGKWSASRPLNPTEEAALRAACAMDEKTILREESAEAYAASNTGTNAKGRLSGRLLSDDAWKLLSESVFPALMAGKTLVVQGSGKVGGSLISSLAPYGVKLIAVADAGGAVIGDGLDPEEILSAVENSRNHPDKSLRASVVHAKKNVRERIEGAAAGARVLQMECDIVAPAALENAVTEETAGNIRAKIEVCGANGPNSSRAEKILADNGITVLYDFLANGAGVTASYFEWLRNLADRFRYEAEKIQKRDFDPACMDPYVMPEFRERLKAILAEREGEETTRAWNLLLRDIMFSAVNEDWRFSKEHGVSMRTAGFVNSQLRVLAAYLSRMDGGVRVEFEKKLAAKTKELLVPFLAHPEAALMAERKQL